MGRTGHTNINVGSLTPINAAACWRVKRRGVIFKERRDGVGIVNEPFSYNGRCLGDLGN
jgi:hypothetical protein